jgi:hypothetical protein
MELMLQHAFVTLVALGAAGVVVWRIATAGKSESEEPPCGSCPTAKSLDRTR